MDGGEEGAEVVCYGGRGAFRGVGADGVRAEDGGWEVWVGWWEGDADARGGCGRNEDIDVRIRARGQCVVAVDSVDGGNFIVKLVRHGRTFMDS